MGPLYYFPFSREDVETLTHHPNERIAALAEIYLCYAFPHERMVRLQRCLQSPNPRKREYACDMVGDEYIEEFKMELHKLIHDPHKNVQAAAKINHEFFE